METLLFKPMKKGWISVVNFVLVYKDNAPESIMHLTPGDAVGTKGYPTEMLSFGRGVVLIQKIVKASIDVLKIS